MQSSCISNAEGTHVRGNTIVHALCLYVGALLNMLDYSYVVDICFRWLDQVHEFCLDSDSDYMNLSWSAFHAHHEKGTSESNLAISSLLPLFEEQAASSAIPSFNGCHLKSSPVLKHGKPWTNSGHGM